MLRTNPGNSNAQTETVGESSPAETPETWDEVLAVPLSAVKLDIPFDEADFDFDFNEAENEATTAAEQSSEMSSYSRSFKGNEPIRVGRANKAGRIESTDQVTARLTLPLRAKLLLVFGGFALLFLVTFGLAGWLFFGLITENQAAVNQHLRLDRTHQLQTAFASEQAAITRQILRAQDERSNNYLVSDFEFLYYHITFENNLFLLRHEPDNQNILFQLNDLEQRYDNVSSTYTQILEDLKAGALTQAARHWQEKARSIEDLTARLAIFGEQQTWIAVQSKEAMEQKHNASLIALGLIAGCGAVLLVLLIWLANRFVIAPMGKLNVKLGQLLYGQTTRITDHLNLLEHEINSQSQKVAAARHDLKIPLTNIRNMAEVSLICNPGLPEEIKESFDEIIETTDCSSKLINSLLARPDNRLELEVVELPGLIERVVELVDLREFKLHVQVELAEAVMDTQLIEHVLLNLLSNARKFSAGGIGIGTRLVPLQWGSIPPKLEGEGEVELWVWNDGPIIAAQEREVIFRPGGQTTIGQQAGGQGLGLSIVKSIVERHGGRVLVESHEKVGTTFRVFLPLPSLANQPANVVPTEGTLLEPIL